MQAKLNMFNDLRDHYLALSGVELTSENPFSDWSDLLGDAVVQALNENHGIVKTTAGCLESKATIPDMFSVNSTLGAHLTDLERLKSQVLISIKSQQTQYKLLHRGQLNKLIAPYQHSAFDQGHRVSLIPAAKLEAYSLIQALTALSRLNVVVEHAIKKNTPPPSCSSSSLSSVGVNRNLLLPISESPDECRLSRDSLSPGSP